MKKGRTKKIWRPLKIQLSNGAERANLTLTALQKGLVRIQGTLTYMTLKGKKQREKKRNKRDRGRSKRRRLTRKVGRKEKIVVQEWM